MKLLAATAAADWIKAEMDAGTEPMLAMGSFVAELQRVLA